MMRKLYMLAAFQLISGGALYAQTFLMDSGPADTVKEAYSPVNGALVGVDNWLRAATDSVCIKTTVLSISKPANVEAWFCDNRTCYAGITVGKSYVSNLYGSAWSMTYHATFFNLDTMHISAKARFTVRAEDTAGHYSRTLSFIAYKNVAGGLSVNAVNAEDVFIYPNPARDYVEAMVDESTGITQGYLQNITGQLVLPAVQTSYSAIRFDLRDIQGGLYFLKLCNREGKVLLTRRIIRE